MRLVELRPVAGALDAIAARSVVAPASPGEGEREHGLAAAAYGTRAA